jgi:hypothetical protein
VKRGKTADFNIYVMMGNVNAKCNLCGSTPTLEYLGLDLSFPQFSLICSKCKTQTRMKIYLTCSKFYPIPYRGTRAFDRLRYFIKHDPAT